MPGTPYNLPDHTVQLTLQYLLPPVPPLPPHLLSNPLRQRHLLLHTSDGSYFCWPSSCSSPDRLLSLLESLSSSSLPPSRISKPAYALPDEQTLLACVDIGGLVRLVWRWEGERNEWGYHDAMLLPAPIGTPVFPHGDIKDALHSLPRNVFSEASNYRSSGGGEDDRDPLDDGTIRPGLASAPAPADYWAGYGSRSPSPENMRGAETDGEDGEGGDEAYWASYERVGGTADSEVPSPFDPEKLVKDQKARAGGGEGRELEERLREMERERERDARGGFGRERDGEGGEKDVEMRDEDPRGRQQDGMGAGKEVSLNSVPPSPVRPHPQQQSQSHSSSSSAFLHPPHRHQHQPQHQHPPASNASHPHSQPVNNNTFSSYTAAAASLEEEEDRLLEEALRGVWRMYARGVGGLARACVAYGQGGGERERERFVAVARRVVGER